MNHAMILLGPVTQDNVEVGTKNEFMIKLITSCRICTRHVVIKSSIQNVNLIFNYYVLIIFHHVFRSDKFVLMQERVIRFDCLIQQTH